MPPPHRRRTQITRLIDTVDSTHAAHYVEAIRRTGGTVHSVAYLGHQARINYTHPRLATLLQDLGYTPSPKPRKRTGTLLALGLVAALGTFTAQILGADLPTLPVLGASLAYYVGTLFYIRSD